MTIAALSVVYAVAYLVVTPAAQRGTSAAEFFQSYHDDPLGLRIANVCLLVSGLLIGLAAAALYARLRTHHHPLVPWALAAAVVSGFASAAHGLGDLLTNGELSERHITGSAADRAAAVALHAQPSAVDPRGLATFGLAGGVAVAFGVALRRLRRRLGGRCWRS